jgi:hypothetical protein
MEDNDKAMVECSTGTLRTLVDGTVRITIDIEPPHRDTALKAFSQPGTPCVLAVLTKEVAKKEMVKAEERKADRCPQAIEYHKKNGKWPSNTADAICKEYNFFLYLESVSETNLTPEYDDLDTKLKFLCGELESKSELDTNAYALTFFFKILANYREFVQDDN